MKTEIILNPELIAAFTVWTQAYKAQDDVKKEHGVTCWSPQVKALYRKLLSECSCAEHLMRREMEKNGAGKLALLEALKAL